MRRLRGEAGTTLPELLVVMVLMGVVGSVVVSWQIGMQRSTAGFTARVNDQADLRTAMAHMTRDLRMAIRPSTGVPAFLPESTASDVRFYVNADSGPPLRVRYFTEPASDGGTQLVRESTPAAGSPGSWNWPAGGTRRTVLVRALVAGAPLITYYDVASAELPPCSEGAVPPCAGPMTSSPTLQMPDAVGSVEIRLAARSRPDLPGDSELRTRVRVANAGLTAIIL